MLSVNHLAVQEKHIKIEKAIHIHAPNAIQSIIIHIKSPSLIT